jgi:hypothetical protein
MWGLLLFLSLRSKPLTQSDLMKHFAALDIGGSARKPASPLYPITPSCRFAPNRYASPQP